MDDESDRYLRQLLHQMDNVVEQANATLAETLKLRRLATTFVTTLRDTYVRHREDMWLEEEYQLPEQLEAPPSD